MLHYLFVFYVLLSVVAFFRYILINPESIMAAAADGSQDAEMTTVTERAAVRGKSADLSCDLPTLLRASIAVTTSDQMDASPESPSGATGLYLKRGDGGGAVVIYHVSPGSPASRSSTSLISAELLAVNNHRVHCAGQAEDLLRHYSMTGKVELLVSLGERPRGCVYLLANNVVDDCGIFSSGPAPQDQDQGGNSHRGSIDGLELDDSSGRLRIVVPPTVGFFRSLKLNKGDAVLSIDGAPVRTIGEARAVLEGCAGGGNGEKVAIIPILTYNCFRKLKSKVMMDMLRVVNGWPTSRRDSGRNSVATVNIEESYDVHEKLGEGAFAVVKRATHRESNTTYALKIVNRHSLNKAMEQTLQDEIVILREMDHPHVMNLFDSYVTINNYYLVAEFLEGGELFDRIVDKESYTECEARDCCRILFGALDYCHKRTICHRDLKPENLLLANRSSDSEIKLADFGFAKKAPDDHCLTTMCGTPGYLAPEILRKEKYGTKCDMFSMGVILFILIGGYPPFYAKNTKDLLRLTKRGKFSFDPEYWSDISDGAKEIITRLLDVKPDRRYAPSDVLSHPWLAEEETKLKRRSLQKSQEGIRNFQIRQRFKAAIHSVMFVNTFTGDQAVFSGRNKRTSVVGTGKEGLEILKGLEDVT